MDTFPKCMYINTLKIQVLPFICLPVYGTSISVQRQHQFNINYPSSLYSHRTRLHRDLPHNFTSATSAEHSHPSTNAGETSKNLVCHICIAVHPLNNCRHPHAHNIHIILYEPPPPMIHVNLTFGTKSWSRSCNERRLPCSLKITQAFLKYAFYSAIPPFNAAISMNGNGHRRALIIIHYIPWRFCLGFSSGQRVEECIQEARVGVGVVQYN